MRKIACNMIICNKCRQLLHSKHRHDFVSCNCKQNVIADGGNEYLRRLGTGYTEASLYIGDDFLKIREHFTRYNFRTMQGIELKNISDEWLSNILEYYIPPDNEGEMDNDYLLLYLQEKQYRNEKEIAIY